MKGTSGIDKGPTSTAGGDGGAEGGAAQADEGDVHPACEDPDEDEENSPLTALQRSPVNAFMSSISIVMQS